MNLLEVRNLSVSYQTDSGVVHAVSDLSFSLNKGETLGLVGETGAGKTTIALSIMGLLPQPPAHLDAGQILFNGNDLVLKKPAEMRKVRGHKITMIFQDPMTALNPVDTVGDQIAEVIRLHHQCSRSQASEQAAQMLEMVGIPRDRYGEYPHQFSGGMKQRVVIAIALACSPDLLIADEPTTALDVTIQAQVLHLMNDIKKKRNMANILITHDLGVVAQMCDKVAIVYAGQIVEAGTLRQIFKDPRHPYTAGLFGSLPDLNHTQTRLRPIQGLMPDPVSLPPGCKFNPRCPYCGPLCKEQEIPLVDVGSGHLVRCCCPPRQKEEKTNG